MITAIQLGNIFTQNDKTIVSGGASGIDVEALVNGLVEARRQPAVVLEGKVETNTKISGAIGNLQSVLNRFRDAASFLRNPPGVQNSSDNIFEYRKASVSSNSSVAGSSYLSVTAAPGAKVTDYSVKIEQLATRNVYTTNTMNITDADTAVVGAGLPLQAGNLALGKDGVVVELENGDTLNEVAAKINASTRTSGVEASTIKVADGQYRLSLRTTKTGVEENYSLGVPVPPAFMQQNAIFRLDADDINGNENYADNPVANQTVAAPLDATGNTAISVQGATPTLLVNGATNGEATFDFANGSYRPANGTLINNNTFQQKAFTFSFKTGANITGTQVIYEQGNGTTGYNLTIAPDAANGNQPTLFAVANSNAWGGANATKVLNLGVVTANTDYNVVLNFDATSSPTAVSTNNLFTGYVNGVKVDEENNFFQMAAHNTNIGIGGSNAGLRLPNGTSSGTTGFYFQGTLNEMALFNRTLSASEIIQTDSYYDTKYVQPINNSAIFSNIGFAITEQAQDAVVQFDGTRITRSSNSIDDIVEGVTFNLLQATPNGTELEVDIEADTELAKQGIINFVDAYNEFRLFASAQTETDEDGAPKEGALLSSNSTLTLTMSRINAEVAAIVDGITNGDPSRLSDIGISFSDFPGDDENPFTRNILVVDEGKLESALASDFDAVRRVFEFDYTTDDPKLQIFERSNAVGVTSFDVNIDQTNNIYTATYKDANNVDVTIQLDATPGAGGTGVVLTGKDGTVLEGMTLIYGDNDDNVVKVNLSQGIGDRMYNTLGDILDEDNGTVSVALRSLSEENERYEQNISRIDDQLEQYREQLLKQFSSLEAAISAANTLLQTLDAQANARNAG